MQLHTQPVDNIEPPYQDVYRTAKACFSYVEASNLFSIRLLQAALLIALYEIPNAIYPAAYLTVGHCARLGHAMGFQDRKRALQMVPSPSEKSILNPPVLLLIGTQIPRRSWKNDEGYGGP